MRKNLNYAINAKIQMCINFFGKLTLGYTQKTNEQFSPLL